MSSRTIVFDIETGPLDEAYLKSICPPFKAEDVKLGNTKDPDKVAAKIKEAEANHFTDYVASAALSPLTGRVLAIGFHAGETPGVMGDGLVNEAEMLAKFWGFLNAGSSEHRTYIVGFNSHRFDLPFLIKRSWKHGITFPLWLRKGRYWSEQSTDLREVWQMGDNQASGSLDAVSKHLGLGGKNGSGAEFAKLWETDRAKAVGYLLNDIKITHAVYKRLVHGL